MDNSRGKKIRRNGKLFTKNLQAEYSFTPSHIPYPHKSTKVTWFDLRVA